LRLRKPDPPKKKVKVKWVNKEFLDMVETVKNNKLINDLKEEERRKKDEEE
jgi:hypothetical protein